ncbi:hypothetical protein SAMN04487910_3853 [Aquimarina amphilecti]|uniref:Uncharacterized protein n=1 Tax=Aquimarina amphilecti TaxID=1038014 RepID=A0A1H7US22_AQUAM|nr:hypothetical protein [Aquimarina amphilecti]SEL99761.1 hypothetical protein SAMN04487910_3853 [Aquimarina amphilecti]
MKHTLLFLFIISFLNCCTSSTKEEKQHLVKKQNKLESEKINTSPKTLIKSGDTIVIKQVHQIENYDRFTIKSSSYLWVTKKDTLDFKIHVREYITDSSKTHVHIDIRHSETVFFSTALKHLKNCIPIIQKDFALKNLGSIQFEGPNAYKDFSTYLPKEYESKYGNEKINYLQVNDFLMQSSMNPEFKKILFSLKKETYEYSIEKFQIRDSIISGITILVRIKNDK